MGRSGRVTPTHGSWHEREAGACPSALLSWSRTQKHSPTSRNGSHGPRLIDCVPRRKEVCLWRHRDKKTKHKTNNLNKQAFLCPPVYCHKVLPASLPNTPAWLSPSSLNLALIGRGFPVSLFCFQGLSDHMKLIFNKFVCFPPVNLSFVTQASAVSWVVSEEKTLLSLSSTAISQIHSPEPIGWRSRVFLLSRKVNVLPSEHGLGNWLRNGLYFTKRSSFHFLQVL